MALRLRRVPSLYTSRDASFDFSKRQSRRSVNSLSSQFMQPKTRRAAQVRHANRVFATTAEPPATEEAVPVVEDKEWIALVANAEFMLHDVQNESLAEQLREKVRLYGERGKEIDFFLVPEPVWLDERYPEKAKLVGRPCVALVSSDPVWMRFMRTRLDQVLEIKLGKLPKEEALNSSGDIPEFEKPKTWRAPYGPYSPGWWKAFYPKEESQESEDKSEDMEQKE